MHSILYYELDMNVVPDAVFDANCKQLMELQKAHREDFISSSYYNTFKDFDGNTGFDLCNKLDKREREKLLRIAEHVGRWGY